MVDVAAVGEVGCGDDEELVGEGEEGGGGGGGLEVGGFGAADGEHVFRCLSLVWECIVKGNLQWGIA